MATPAEKKRTLEESRARALEYQASLKRKTSEAAGSPSTGSHAAPRSSKKPRTKATPNGKRKGKSAQQDDERAKKVAQRLESRKRAKKFATKSLPNGVGAGEGAGEGEGASDESDDESDGMDTRTSDGDEPAPTRTKPSPSPAALRSRPADRPNSAVRPIRPNQRMVPAVVQPPAVPPMPAIPSPTASVPVARRGFSFLRHATTTHADPGAAVLNDSRPNSETRSGPAGPGHYNSSGRPSFLSRGTVTPPAPVAAADDSIGTTLGNGNVIVNVAEQQEEPEAARRQGVEARAQRRARIWALNCAVALAPVMFFFLASGLLRAWPHVQLGAGKAWGTLRGFGTRNPAAEKCFLLPSERDTNRAVCKNDAEVEDCPDQATCGGGSILACEFPLEKKMDGSGCILTPEAKEEVNAVVKALRNLTVEQLCKGSGLIMPSPKAFSTRSYITLTDAAAAQNRGPLSFLAGMPPGNVAGLIDLEGEAALDFGGGGGGEGLEGNSNKGSGSERIARLSEGAYNAVMRTPSWRCRARLAVGSWLMAYWPHCLGFYAMILIAACLDLRRLKNYKKHAQVCTMRDQAYQALLDHAAKDSTPMQVSHIQISVGDKRRTSGAGSQAAIQRNVSKLWPLVEKEVEHDTRIRRNYKSVLGQRNVACWQWVGSAGTTFDKIGALDPGRAPRLWLLRWIN